MCLSRLFSPLLFSSLLSSPLLSTSSFSLLSSPLPLFLSSPLPLSLSSSYGGDYFAADEGDFAFQYSPQTTLFRGDQSDGAFLASMLAESGGDFDIIVDDGSHNPAHMLFTFDMLFAHLRPGGLYIFEDVETSYWNQEGAGLYKTLFEQPLGIGAVERSVIERFKGVVDDGRNMNGIFVGPKSREARDEGRTKMKWEDDIAEVSFAQNIIVVRKKEAAEDWFYNSVRQGHYVHHLMTF